MTYDEAVAMLSNPEAQVDVDGLVALLGSQHERLGRVGTLLELDTNQLEAFNDGLEGIVGIVSKSETLNERVCALTAQVEAASANIVDRVVGLMAVMSESDDSQDRYRRRAVVAEIADLYADLDDWTQRACAQFQVPRLTDTPNDVDADAFDGNPQRDISGYRV